MGKASSVPRIASRETGLVASSVPRIASRETQVRPKKSKKGLSAPSCAASGRRRRSFWVPALNPLSMVGQSLAAQAGSQPQKGRAYLRSCHVSRCQAEARKHTSLDVRQGDCRSILWQDLKPGRDVSQSPEVKFFPEDGSTQPGNGSRIHQPRNSDGATSFI